MEQKHSEVLLILTANALRFASEHPYAATGIVGAAAGSAITYRVMTLRDMRQKATKVFTPKVYQFILPATDLRQMLVDPIARDPMGYSRGHGHRHRRETGTAEGSPDHRHHRVVVRGKITHCNRREGPNRPNPCFHSPRNNGSSLLYFF
jgi:hypothetical protein